MTSFNLEISFHCWRTFYSSSHHNQHSFRINQKLMLCLTLRNLAKSVCFKFCDLTFCFVSSQFVSIQLSLSNVRWSWHRGDTRKIRRNLTLETSFSKLDPLQRSTLKLNHVKSSYEIFERSRLITFVRRLSCTRAYFEHVRSKYAYPGNETKRKSCKTKE